MQSEIWAGSGDGVDPAAAAVMPEADGDSGAALRAAATLATTALCGGVEGGMQAALHLRALQLGLGPPRCCRRRWVSRR